MPDPVEPANLDVAPPPAEIPVATAPVESGVAEAHAPPHGGGHGGYDFAQVLASHNLPYPAWEPVHGNPLLIFDLGSYAAHNFAVLSADDRFATADGSAYLTWAQQVADTPLAHGIRADRLATAMAVANQKSWMGSCPPALSWLNQQTFFGTIVLLLLASILLIFARRKPEQIKPVNRIQHMIEAVVLFVRNDIVRPNIHHGDAWVPHFAAIFFAILVCNLTEVVPGIGTPTGNIAVTSGLAFTTLVSMLFFGMKEQGLIRFWINLVPVKWSPRPGDMAIWFMLAGIELMGLIIKPSALAIRLFANMFAGHAVLLAFAGIGLIVWANKPEMNLLSGAMGAFGLVMTTLVLFLELLVAFIQAYVFTLLSAVFIGSCMHPQH
jgi:F-type H+-transporting ATPase subunit a